jgi:hypothetical protein
MTESNRDNLENFFKKKTGNPDIEFHEADWNKLKAQLDKEMPLVNPFWTFIKKIAPVLLLTLLTFFGWKYIIKSNDTIDEKSEPKEVYSDLNSPTAKSRIENKNTIETVRESNEGTKVDATEILQLSNNNKKALTNQDITTTIQPVEVSDANSKNIGYVVSGNGDEAFRLREASILHFLSPIAPVSLIYPMNPEQPGTTEMEEIKKSPGLKSSFILGAGYSPDFSTIGLDNFIAPGSRLKLYLEYNYKNTIALSTGLEWVNNKYEAYGYEYHAPERYWKKGIAADEAYGECVMLDIPLNIRYQVISHGQHQFFISAGASTYFLLKEDYYFTYETEDPELPHHWGTEKMSVYPFGIINASLGYEYKFRSRGSLQLEPYIKIPTGGIGWGNVDLHTIGAYISYRYRLGKL